MIFNTYKTFGFIVFLLIISNTKSIAQNTKKPNIIFIMTDDQSAVVPLDSEKRIQSRPFGFNGDKEVHTPIIDNLAKNGMIFNSAYVSSSVCVPSRYTMLTGRYAGRSEGPAFMRMHPEGTMTRVENNTEIEKDKPNLPRLLQEVGYKTGFVGKSHIVEHNIVNNKKNWAKNGFQTYAKNADPNDPAVSKKMFENHQKWTEVIKKYGFDYANGVYAGNLREQYNDSLNVHNVEWKNKAALEFIDENKNDPFFLYYSETVPHGPAPYNMKNGKYFRGLDSNPKFTGQGLIDADYSYLPTREEIKQEIKNLDKKVAHAWLRWFDHAVGAVVDKLKAEGIYENTIIIITSDHGNYNGGKTSLYESGTKVPLMMHWPNGIKSNQEYNELVQNIDFTPTFLELAGIKLKNVKSTLDGISLKKVLKGNKKPVHDYLFFEMGFARSVMTKDWKYISVRYDKQKQNRINKGLTFKGWKGAELQYPYYTRNGHLGNIASKSSDFYFDADQVFDLVKDPRETKNIFKDNREKAEELKILLTKSLKLFPNRPYAEFVN
ncbi:MAG: sulfatase-like hydrolase/transferase [Polaribacter sp.]|jgi:arylsulfatase A-like enzyme|nr:sulfatase-like hydrolase/transferase [Polaribacter sp.]